MPSWNIHAAHAERLLREEGASRLGVRDEDAFLVGNLVPDIYVGYMVQGLDRTIEYKVTHFADPVHVPEPRFWEFWERYAVPNADARGRVSDVVLGAWTHLMADHVYNHCTNAFLRDHGIAPGEKARIGKQGDFDLFGRSLDIVRSPSPTPEVIRQCSEFPQYQIAERDVYAACGVMASIVEDNRVRHVKGVPPYVMLTEEFFSLTTKVAQNLMVTSLLRYATEGAQACLCVREPLGPPIYPVATPFSDKIIASKKSENDA